MNNYCIHLKKRKNKPYCNLINKEIMESIDDFNKSDKDIRTYRPDYDTVAMGNYEWLYELTEDEYTDLLERAKECT